MQKNVRLKNFPIVDKPHFIDVPAGIVQPWMPVAAWMLAAGLLLVIVLRRVEGGTLQRV